MELGENEGGGGGSKGGMELGEDEGMREGWNWGRMRE